MDEEVKACSSQVIPLSSHVSWRADPKAYLLGVTQCCFRRLKVHVESDDRYLDSYPTFKGWFVLQSKCM